MTTAKTIAAPAAPAAAAAPAVPAASATSHVTSKAGNIKKVTPKTVTQKQSAKKAAPRKAAVKKIAITKPLSKAFAPANTHTAKASNAPKTVKAVKTIKPVKLEKPKKPKLVRDSFTIPKAEYLVLEALKLRAAKLTRSVKKSELLRAGIKALASLSDAAFLSALEKVPTIKTGRPAAAK